MPSNKLVGVFVADEPLLRQVGYNMVLGIVPGTKLMASHLFVMLQLLLTRMMMGLMKAILLQQCFLHVFWVMGVFRRVKKRTTNRQVVSCSFIFFSLRYPSFLRYLFVFTLYFWLPRIFARIANYLPFVCLLVIRKFGKV